MLADVTKKQVEWLDVRLKLICSALSPWLDGLGNCGGGSSSYLPPPLMKRGVVWTCPDIWQAQALKDLSLWQCDIVFRDEQCRV